MAGSSDKARFYLEQSIPELKDFERRNIFSSDEIAAIVKKKSEFEHKLNSRGSKPSDYARYAEFEINVDTLRQKRVKRLGLRNSGHSGKRNVFSILQRGIKKFPGDISLCMQEIEYARSQKSFKKLSQILTRALRLHPSRPDLWIYAAQLAMEEQGDVTEARSYMQRGLRFCKNSRLLWSRYLRLEFLHLAKVAARRRLLELESDGEPTDGPKAVGSLSIRDMGMQEDSPITEDADSSLNNEIASPEPNVRPRLPPAASDAVIPTAIFDAAMEHFGCNEDFARELFDMTCDIDLGPCKHRILDHMVQYLQSQAPGSWRLAICRMKLNCVDVHSESPEFPACFKNSLKVFRTASPHGEGATEFAVAVEIWLAAFLENPDLDSGLRQVMTATMEQLRVKSRTGSGPGDRLVSA